MKKTLTKLLNLILVITMVMSLTSYVSATTIGEIKDDIKKNQDALTDINDSLIDLQDVADLLEEEISDLDAELVNTMAEIGILEDNIKEKEAQIEIKQEEYEAAKADEEGQYAAMVSRIQFIYETGETDFIKTLFSSADFSQILNQASYIEAIYSYDRLMLDQYIEKKDQVKDLWDQLEIEKQSLNEDKAAMEEQKKYLDDLLVKKKAESKNYEAQIVRAKQEANALKVKIKQEQAELKKLEEEERRKAAAKGNYTVSVSVEQIISNASGSDLGKQIARYGCQYIGYPYVSGGTSLTKGADCSGFIYRIYKDFGYNIDRTSYQQRSTGREVAYSDAQPGDIICYDGHVALYIGGGYIVHASSAKTGIKLGKAAYRTILTVRRVIK